MSAWHWFVSQDEWFIVAGLAILPILSAVVIFWVARSACVKALITPSEISVSYIGAITLLFSLFSAFMLGDIWHRETAVSDLVYKEAQALLDVADLSVICGAPCAPIAAAGRRYANLLIELEWNEEWSEPAAQSQSQLDAMVPLLAELEIQGLSPAIRSGLLAAYRELRQVRSERYALVNYDMAPHRWAMIMILGILTQIALASLNVGRPASLIVVLGVFTVAFVAILAYTAYLAWPTVEETVLPPSVLKQITALPH